ncbi:ABC transporter ATP-binding protein [soil metagenome]
MLSCTIVKRFDDFHLRVELEAGDEVVVLLGPSGAGKSLTLQSVAGLVKPGEGRISLNQRALFDADRRIQLSPQERRVGYVFQNYALFPHLTVAGNVGYGLHRLKRDQRRARIAEVLRMVRLEAFMERRPDQLSGGQQQRVALARALATDPELLLLDEPFAALDAPIRTELRREFLALRRQLGIPALFVTHDLEEAAVLADRIVVIVDGQVRQSGPTRQILDQPADADVADLVQARNILKGKLVWRGEAPVVETRIGTLPVDSGRAGGLDGAVNVVIRPEVIRIVRDDRPLGPLRDDAMVCGVVLEVLDHGARSIVYVDVGGQPIEVALSPTAARRQSLAAGAAVRLSIPPDDIYLMSGHSGD